MADVYSQQNLIQVLLGNFAYFSNTFLGWNYESMLLVLSTMNPTKWNKSTKKNPVGETVNVPILNQTVWIKDGNAPTISLWEVWHRARCLQLPFLKIIVIFFENYIVHKRFILMVVQFINKWIYYDAPLSLFHIYAPSHRGMRYI